MDSTPDTPRGLRPIVHKTKSQNDIVPDKVQNMGNLGDESEMASEPTSNGPQKIRIERCKYMDCEPVGRSRESDDDASTSNRDPILLRELEAIKTLMSNVMEVSPRGSQFERLLSRADAQVGNANAAISRIVLLDKSVKETLASINETLTDIKVKQRSNRILLDSCMNTIDMLKTTILEMHRNAKKDSKMLHTVFEMLVEQESATNRKDDDSRIANIESMLLALGNTSETE